MRKYIINNSFYLSQDYIFHIQKVFHLPHLSHSGRKHLFTIQ